MATGSAVALDMSKELLGAAELICLLWSLEFWIGALCIWIRLSWPLADVLTLFGTGDGDVSGDSKKGPERFTSRVCGRIAFGSMALSGRLEPAIEINLRSLLHCVVLSYLQLSCAASEVLMPLSVLGRSW